MLARNRELGAGRVVAAKALGAMAASLVRSDQHALTERQTPDGRTDLGDRADDLAAADVRHGNLDRQTLPDPQIEMVQPAGQQAHEDLVGLDHGDWNVHRLENVDAARAGEGDGSHGRDAVLIPPALRLRLSSARATSPR